VGVRPSAVVPVRWSAIGVLVAVAAVAVYALMWLGYRQDWSWLDAADSSSLDRLHSVGIKHPSWVRFWEVVCVVFGPTVVRLLGAVVAVVAMVKRRLRAATFLVVSVGFSELITQAAKTLAGRPRPATALVYASSSSFPSGHAVAVLVTVLALLTVLLPTMSRRLGVVAMSVGALIVLAVGFGRVALNVHHPSDVLGGWALGYLYFAACARAFRVGRRQERRLITCSLPQGRVAGAKGVGGTGYDGCRS
jgi:membrane-associated phospholipid phosphatase